MRRSLHLAIRKVARRLARPAKAGVYVSIPDLVGIAGRLDVPLPVRQDREWVAEELLKAAHDYGKLRDACREIIELIRKRVTEVEELIKAYPRAGSLLSEALKAAKETIREVEELASLVEGGDTQTA